MRNVDHTNAALVFVRFCYIRKDCLVLGFSALFHDAQLGSVAPVIDDDGTRSKSRLFASILRQMPLAIFSMFRSCKNKLNIVPHFKASMFAAYPEHNRLLNDTCANC